MNITLSVTLYTQITLPSHIHLLSADENMKEENMNEHGAWYVRWDTLHYCDKDGHWQEFELDLDWENSDAYKRPKIVDCNGNMPETEDESEDESEDERDGNKGDGVFYEAEADTAFLIGQGEYGGGSNCEDESEDDSEDEDNCRTMRSCEHSQCGTKGTRHDGFMIDTDGEWWCDTHYHLVKDKYRGARQIECDC